MKILNTRSLSATLDTVNEAFFYGRSLSESQRGKTAKWIAERQGKAGSYAQMFAPTEDDFREGIRLFTGEKISSRAGIAHILGEEACRVLILLNAPLKSVQDSLRRASLGMAQRLEKARNRDINAGRRWSGMYCCGRCTSALWRHLTVGGLKDAEGERWLAAGIEALKHHRIGNGRWRRFAFHYTLLTLSEIALASAVEEMRYASPICEQYLRRPPKDDAITQRRRLLAEKILERC
ncbi:MAG: hypothetical protein AMS15_04840 [Planctomycetes bacterium DG_23]|nr:MAG: hypothetical protein AMS15_04840 [Planctomycetes bacterium DG_23]